MESPSRKILEEKKLPQAKQFHQHQKSLNNQRRNSLPIVEENFTNQMRVTSRSKSKNHHKKSLIVHRRR